MSITAEQKIQCICTECKTKFSCKNSDACTKCGTEISKMKKPTIFSKTYYHCTKKNTLCKCAQGSIEEVELESQILSELETLEIHEDFYRWAVDALKEMNVDESKEQELLLSHSRKRETELTNRLSNLVMMRANGEIDADQLRQIQNQTNKELIHIRNELAETHNRSINWVSLANDYLNFSQNVAERFKNGGPQVKKQILSCIGSNLTIMDKKLNITRIPALVQIKKVASVYTGFSSRLEPKNPLTNKEISSDFVPSERQIAVLCAGKGSNLRRHKVDRFTVCCD